MKKIVQVCLICFAAFVVMSGTVACRTNEVLYVDDNPHFEGRIAVQRPQIYSLGYALFGINTLAEILEVTYVKNEPNAAGQNVLKVGIRYKGFSSWYNFWRRSPHVLKIGAEAKFYKASTVGQHFDAPVFVPREQQRITLNLGNTFDFTTTCPVPEGRDFQLLISEQSGW